MFFFDENHGEYLFQRKPHQKNTSWLIYTLPILSFKMGCKSFLKQCAHVLAASAQLPTRWRWEGGWYERLRLWPTLPTLSRQGSAWLGWWWTRICWSWCHMATGGREPSHSWPASWQATGGRRRLVLCRGFPFTPPKPPRDFLMAEFLGNPATAPPPPVDKAVGLASSSRVVSPSLDNDQWSGWWPLTKSGHTRFSCHSATPTTFLWNNHSWRNHLPTSGGTAQNFHLKNLQQTKVIRLYFCRVQNRMLYWS